MGWNVHEMGHFNLILRQQESSVVAPQTSNIPTGVKYNFVHLLLQHLETLVLEYLHFMLLYASTIVLFSPMYNKTWAIVTD